MAKRKSRVVDTGSWKDDYPNLPFNPYKFPQRGKYLDGDGNDIADLFDTMGVEVWEDVLSEPKIWTNPSARDPKKDRPGWFSKPQDAIFMAWEMGVLEFSTFYMDKKGKWHLYIEGSDPARARK